MNIQTIKIQKLKPAKYNPRKDLKPEDEEYQKIKRSLIEFGYVAPIIVNSDMTVIGGHQRLKVLQELGYTEIECNVVDLDKTQEKALNIALNKISGEWDNDKLEGLLAELKETELDISVTGFSFDEVDNMLNEIIGSEEDEFDVEENLKQIEEPITKNGDIWILGKHRLMCGDSTSIENLKKLIKDKKGKCLFTSPPYNMNGGMYENYNDNLKSKEYIDFNMKVIDLWTKYLKGYLFWNISYNKNSRWEFIEIIYKIIKETGLKFLELIVWDKGHGIPIVSKDMLTRQYEDILLMGNEDVVSAELELYYLGTTEQRAYFNKLKGKGITNYWKIDTNNSQLDNHKACFPIGLPTKAIKLTTNRDDIILEPFGGSGSTLIAAEQTKRICYMMELDPKYCDVIVKRWEKLTGNTAVLEK